VLARAGQTDEAIATLYHAEQLAPPSVELESDLCDALLARGKARSWTAT